MISFRDETVERLGVKLLSYTNEEARAQGVNPFDHGGYYTHAMKTVALKAALTEGGYDAAFGGARRDEEKSRAKERVFSFRTATHEWDPKNQRPEFWHLYNGRVNKGESVRVFPLSNWTELDIWTYIMIEGLPVVPLYFAAERPTVMRDGTIIVVDDEARMRYEPGETPVMRRVRFRSLGCWPLSGAVESDATTLQDIVAEMLATRVSERGGRLIDKDASDSMEKKKREGYF
jgi:sulfate adenylyltransferase subunit 2